MEGPLLAASALSKSGDDTFFASAGGRIVDRKTKREIHSSRAGGIYLLDVLMAPARARAATPRHVASWHRWPGEQQTVPKTGAARATAGGSAPGPSKSAAWAARQGAA
eukprot:5493068-Alexandrium_andersonii.AAC.1